uniref:Ig-like domain-containing protein n=1 Tax=Lates calcarifer TaxID=8187 RepID=A0A4W6DIE8_LATCA
MNVIRTLTLITTLPLVLASPGINHASCPTEPIQAEEGDDVTLQCHVDHSVNLTKYTLDFTRADLSKKIVHAYRHGKDDPDPQMSEYRGRTTLIHADLSRGNMTLLISSVQMSDTGQYRCFVLDLAASCTIVLNVGESAGLNSKFTSLKSHTVKKFVPKSDGCDLKKCLFLI